MQVDRFAVNADVRDSSTRGNNRLADLKGGRYTDRLDGDIDTSASVNAMTCSAPCRRYC